MVDLNLGSLAAGTHTIRVVLDSGAVLAETDETDNEFTRTFVVNAAPTISDPGPLMLNEDQGTPSSASFTIADAETPVTSLTVQAATSNAAIVAIDGIALIGSGATRQVQVTPVADAFGAVDLTLTVDDGTGGRASRTFMVTVQPVNDPPTFLGGPSPTVLEDSGGVSVPGWAQAITVGPPNESGQTVHFTAMITNPALFAALPAVSPAGVLTFTPAENANGSAMVTVQLVDDGPNGGADSGVSAAYQFTITVLAVNDPPTFVIGSFTSVNEDSGPVAIDGWVSIASVGPANESGQTLQFAVTTDVPALFAADPAIDSTGKLTFTPAANANGTAHVTVIAQDSGGTTNGGVDRSVALQFTIVIAAVNDAPTFTLAGDLAAAQDAGSRVIPGFASAISPGPADESAQTVSFAVVAADPSLFAVPPAIAPNGTLTFAPLFSASGSTMITVTATDSGGASSAPQTFRLSVTSFAEEVGNFSGLIAPLDVDGSAVDQVGKLAFTISKTGKLTGSLTIGRLRKAVKGFVQQDGVIRFGTVPNTPTLEIPRRGQSTVRLALTLDVANGSGQITGTISDAGVPIDGVVADRAAYDARRNPASLLAGKYTALLPHRTGTNHSIVPTAYPQGDGALAIKVKTSGVVQFAGMLADGSKVSASAMLSSGNRVGFFAPTDRKLGAVSGFVQFAPVAGISDLTATDLLWYKPAASRPGRYQSGWPGGIYVDLLGSSFAATPGQSILPGLGAVDANGNALFQADGGGLGATVLKPLTIDTRNRVAALSPGADRLKLKLNARSGLVTGSFGLPSGPKPAPLSGAVLQVQSRIGGYLLGLNESGSFSVVPSDTP